MLNILQIEIYSLFEYAQIKYLLQKRKSFMSQPNFF